MASATVIERLRAGGIVVPEICVAEAQRAGIRLELAAALLEKESHGGQNVFGHDRDKQQRLIFPAREGTVKVTKKLYLEYRKRRRASGNAMMQGVGPCQLTWWEFQDEADREGGCWKPEVNVRVGYRRLAGHIKALGEPAGCAKYNGSGPDAQRYSEDLLKRAAAWKARLDGATPVDVPATDRPLRLGDSGPKVVRLTRKLSRVRSKRTGAAYLNGARKQFDAAAEAALRAFQGEHRLEVDGVYGPRSQRKLNRVLRLQAETPVKPAKPVADVKPVAKPVGLKALVREVQRRDAQTGEAWEALVAHGTKRERQLGRVTAKQAAAGPPLAQAMAAGFEQVTAVLREIDTTLDELVAEQRREEAAAATTVAVPAEVGGGGGGGGVVPPDATIEQMPPPAEPLPEGPAPPSPAAAAPAEPAKRDLNDLSDDELLERIERLDRALDRSRAVMIRRYAAIERELAELAPVKAKAKPKPGPGTAKPKQPPVITRPGQMPREDVIALQKALNEFTEKHLKSIGGLIVDGVTGPATKKRIREAKFYLGYSGKGRRSVVVDKDFRRRLDHPRSARFSSPAMLTRALRRRRKQRKVAKISLAPHAGVTTFDGKPVAAWLKPYLVWARNNGWKGGLNSGWRDPVYSEQLCRNMCGAPSCPGKCAGRSSNHAGSVKPHGAVDVSDYVTFGQLMRRCPLEPKLHNALGAADPVHFSVSGR